MINLSVEVEEAMERSGCCNLVPLTENRLILRVTPQNPIIFHHSSNYAPFPYCIVTIKNR